MMSLSADNRYWLEFAVGPSKMSWMSSIKAFLVFKSANKLELWQFSTMESTANVILSKLTFALRLSQMLMKLFVASSS